MSVVLLAPRGAASFAGVGFLEELGKQCGEELVVDCDDQAGLVLAGLRQGLKDLVYTGRDATRTSLKSIADQLGARIRPSLPEPDLDLDPSDDAGWMINQWYQTLDD